MKTNSKLGLVFLLGTLICHPSFAQEKDKKNDKEKKSVITLRGYPVGDYGEIIIKRKSSENDVKLNIELKKDGELLINGKPQEEFNSNDVAVILRNPPVISFNGSALTRGMAFSPGVSFMAGETAFLGVILTGDEENGAKILSLSDDSPAAKAGLKKDDIIIGVDDKKIETSAELTETIRSKSPGDEVEIKYLRDNKKSSLKLKLAESKTYNFQNNINERIFRDFGNASFDFFSLRSPKIGIQAQDTEDEEGAKILKVEDGTPAAGSGLKENDIITSFNEKPVKNVDDLVRHSRSLAGKSNIPVEVLRNGKKESLTIKIPKKLKTAEL